MKSFNKEFRSASLGLLLTACATIAIVVTGVTKSVAPDPIMIEQNAKLRTSGMINKYLVTLAEEKYANEMLLNFGKDNKQLKKLALDAQKRRNALADDISTITCEIKGERTANFYRESIQKLNKDINKLISESTAAMAKDDPEFKTPDWSDKLNNSLEEVEKMAALAAGDASRNAYVAHHMASVIVNAYRQIFMISMYASNGSGVDDLGQMMFLGYEKEITSSWQKLQARAWFDSYESWFITNFKHKYFDSFSGFKNSFVSDKNSDVTKLFREFNLIVKNYGEFCDEACAVKYSVLGMKDLVSTTNCLCAMIMLLLLCTCIMVRRMEFYARAIVNSHHVAQDVQPIAHVNEAPTNAIEVRSPINIVPIISEHVRHLAIENHRELNATYSVISDSVNKIREKLNAMEYQSSKLKEMLDAHVAKYENSCVADKLDFLSNTSRILREIGISLERISYSSIEDMANEVLDSSNKVDAIKTSIADICRQVEGLCMELSTSYTPEGLADERMMLKLKKLSQMALLKMEGVHAWSEDIKKSNDEVVRIIRGVNNTISNTRSRVGDLLEKSVIQSDSQEDVTGDFVEENNLFVKNVTKDYLEANKESVELINKNLVVFKENTVGLVNAMSSFKEVVLEQIDSYSDISELDLDDAVDEEMHDVAPDIVPVEHEMRSSNKVAPIAPRLAEARNKFCNYRGKSTTYDAQSKKASA